MQSNGSGNSGVGPSVVVDIGCTEPELVDLDRRGPDLAGVGRDATLDLVTEARVPLVQHRPPVDPVHRMIRGQSFGGAFVLEARVRQAGARTGLRAARRSGAISTHGSSLSSVLCRAVVPPARRSVGRRPGTEVAGQSTRRSPACIFCSAGR